MRSAGSFVGCTLACVTLASADGKVGKAQESNFVGSHNDFDVAYPHIDLHPLAMALSGTPADALPVPQQALPRLMKRAPMLRRKSKPPQRESSSTHEGVSTPIADITHKDKTIVMPDTSSEDKGKDTDVKEWKPKVAQREGSGFMPDGTYKLTKLGLELKLKGHWIDSAAHKPSGGKRKDSTKSHQHTQDKLKDLQNPDPKVSLRRSEMYKNQAKWYPEKRRENQIKSNFWLEKSKEKQVILENAEAQRQKNEEELLRAYSLDPSDQGMQGGHHTAISAVDHSKQGQIYGHLLDQVHGSAHHTGQDERTHLQVKQKPQGQGFTNGVYDLTLPGMEAKLKQLENERSDAEHTGDAESRQRLEAKLYRNTEKLNVLRDPDPESSKRLMERYHGRIGLQQKPGINVQKSFYWWGKHGEKGGHIGGEVATSEHMEQNQ